LQAIVSCEKLDAVSCHLAGIRKVLQEHQEASALAAAVQQDVLMLDMEVPEPTETPLQLEQQDGNVIEADPGQEDQQTQAQLQEQQQQQQQQQQEQHPEVQG
jgi:hypothetical protein